MNADTQIEVSSGRVDLGCESHDLQWVIWGH